MRHAATRALFAYWDDLRGARCSPERGEIDPAAIRGVLADTFMLEVDAARRFPFRLSGTRLDALFTADLKGRPFTELWECGQRGEIGRILCGICDDAAVVTAGAIAASDAGPTITFELLLLPVRHIGKTHARILGCLAPVTLPSWLGQVPPRHLELMGWRSLAPGPTASDAGVESCATATSLGGGSDRPGGKEGVRRAHFIVYDGGRRKE